MFLIGEKAQCPFATVWAVEDKGNYVQGRISTSEKDNREEVKYINSNWFARFVGKAKDKSLELQERDRIKILSGKITNTMGGEGENRRSYLNVIIFDFELLDSPSSNTNAENNNDSSEELPFDDLPF